MKHDLIIAIDGPAGSGKTTTAKILSRKLKYIYLDTGAMYRAVTLAWIRSGLELSEENLIKIMEENPVDLENSQAGQITLLAGQDVSREIRSAEVTKFVSPVSAIESVREKMVAKQRKIGENGGVVMDGRDIGTVVFPNAHLKIFLIASIDARAKRRVKEMQESGMEADYQEIRRQIINRDKYDSTREISPLRKAQDAIEIDTSNLTIDQQVNKIYHLALEIGGQ